MDRKLSVLTKQAIFELGHKKFHWLLLGILLIVFWLPLFVQMRMIHIFSTGHSAPISQVGHTVTTLFHTAVFFGMALSSIFASKLVQTEIEQRTISAVMVRPVRGGEFLLGKILGVLFFFIVFLSFAVASMGLAKLFCSFEFPEFFFPGVAQHVCMGFAMITLGVALGAVLSPNFIVGLFVFGWLFLLIGANIPSDLHWLINAFKAVLHYGLPAGIQVDLLSIDTADMPFDEYRMRVAEMVENIMYGIFVFILASDWFSRRDVKLRESV